MGEEPPGYYAGAEGLTGARLARVLHQIIDDHQRYPYTSSEIDTWDIIHEADGGDVEGRIRDLYRNRLFETDDHWSDSNRDGWNREHSWPKSYGFAELDDCNSAYTDVHALFASDADYNEARGNVPFDWVEGGTALPVDDFGFANFVDGRYESGSFEVWPFRRGDVARAMFYMATRYDGGINERNGCAEPDLRLTGERAEFVWSSSNLDVAYMGILSTLIEWHLNDPVDDHERRRHEIVFSYQGNRNPFIDRPEWVCELWSCGTDALLVASVMDPVARDEILLEWSGLSGEIITVIRDGEIIEETANDGSFVDRVTPSGSYRYRVCQTGTYVCGEASVSVHRRRRSAHSLRCDEFVCPARSV